MPPRLTLRSRRVLLSDGIGPADLRITGDRIETVADHGAIDGHAEDVGDAVVMPGVIDVHVHLNDPGRAEWEGFGSGTRAAASGGVTTVVDMPLNAIPPVTSVAGLEAKVRAAEGRCSVRVGLWGGVVPGNEDELEPLWRGGVLGFKTFLSPSGVPEFSHVGEAELRRALPVLADLGAPLLVHAEDPALLRPVPAGCTSYAEYAASRPAEAEASAVRTVARLAGEAGARAHIVHLSSRSGIAAVREAKDAGVAITAETCPHYLTFADEEIAAGRSDLKCAPPIRTAADREALWEALADGTLDLVATDHSPAPPEMKRGTLDEAWGGIASLQLLLPVVWTGARARGHGIADLHRWLSAGPAGLIGAERPVIARGAHADLTVWEPEAEWTVEADALQHRHSVTPYAGMRLTGRVRGSLVGGRWAYRDGVFPDEPVGGVMRRGER